MESEAKHISATIAPVQTTTPCSESTKSKRRTPPWPDGPVHRMARRIGCRHPIKLPMKQALRLADALGYFSYGKTMALWEAENATLPGEALQRPTNITELAAQK